MYTLFPDNYCHVVWTTSVFLSDLVGPYYLSVCNYRLDVSNFKFSRI